jgi:hypothetical protein
MNVTTAKPNARSQGRFAKRVFVAEDDTAVRCGGASSTGSRLVIELIIPCHNGKIEQPV